jgi:hypothetical protein
MYSIYFRWIGEYSLENVLIAVLVNKRKRYIIMKKKLITIVIGAMLCAGLFAGCGQSDTKQDKAAAGTENAKQADTKDEGEKDSQEEKELTGTIDDIKDFMFVVTDDKDTPYSFTFDEKPDGLESVASGDKVTVKYTGTISEVDPFEGKIISVEKAE